MKTFSITRTILCLVALVAFASCSKEELPISPENTLPEVITVSVEENTKMTIENYRPVWRLNDLICIAGVKYRCTVPSTGTFVRDQERANDGTNICCYPYSMHKGKNSFSLPYIYQQHDDIDFIPMIGTYDSQTNKVSFKNLGSVCRFRIKNTSEQTIYTKSMIITPTFSNAATMHINGAFSVSFNTEGIPQINWTDSHQPFEVINFKNVVTLEPGGYHDVYAFLPAYDYAGLNIRTEGYLTQECNEQVYFSSVNKGAATVARNTWYDIPVKADSWSAGVRGNGTPEIPFELGSEADITYINDQIKSQDENSKNYFKQAVYTITNDITISNDWNQTIGGSVELQGIGVFSGVFDGQGHKFTVASGKKGYRPLFWDVDGAVIKNLIIEGEFHNEENFGTFSPFFYSALNTKMVACVFNGTVTSSNNDDYKVYVFGAMNATSYLAGCAYNGSATDGTHAGVGVDNDHTSIPDDHITIFVSNSGNVSNLNTALRTWNSTASESAKTDYRYQWSDGKLVLNKTN